jgi:hypothetical protein
VVISVCVRGRKVRYAVSAGGPAWTPATLPSNARAAIARPAIVFPYGLCFFMDLELYIGLLLPLKLLS